MQRDPSYGAPIPTTPCPVAAGHCPSAQARALRHHATRIDVVAFRTAARFGHLTDTFGAERHMLGEEIDERTDTCSKMLMADIDSANGLGVAGIEVLKHRH